jgi:tetratricopeptide (TPR) repeat protein
MVGLCYLFHYQKLGGDKKLDEAKTFVPQVEAAMKDAAKTIVEAARTALDPRVREGLDAQEFQTKFQLARFFLLQEIARYPDVGPMLDEMETRWGSHKDYASQIQDLRGRLFLAQGKFDEAEAWVLALAKKDPKSAAGPASQLARALDERAAELRKTAPDSIEADRLWQRAAKHYYNSVAPQISGAMAQDTTQMREVGSRLFVYGLHFNGVPADRTSFVDWVAGAKVKPEHWNTTIAIFESALAQYPDYKMSIGLARTYGFLARWLDAAKVYQRIFEDNPILAPGGKKLDANVMKAKGDLVFAYLEWGVAEEMAAPLDKDNAKDHFTRAINAFTALVNTLKVDTSPQIWWAAKYHQLKAYADLGQYKDAQLGLEDVIRNVNAKYDEGKFGYQKLLDELAAELKVKLQIK